MGAEIKVPPINWIINIHELIYQITNYELMNETLCIAMFGVLHGEGVVMLSYNSAYTYITTAIGGNTNFCFKRCSDHLMEKSDLV